MGTLGMIVLAYNTSTWQAEPGQLKAADHSRLYNNTLYKPKQGIDSYGSHFKRKARNYKKNNFLLGYLVVKAKFIA